MKGKLNITIRVIIFIIIGLFILQFLTGIFVPKWTNPMDPASTRFKEFYSQDNNTIDVLAMGSSNIVRGYSPLKVWDEYGITSFNIGTSMQIMPFTYYILEETLEYQMPEVIVLDTDVFFINADTLEGEYRKLFDNMKMGKSKIKALNDNNLNIDDKLSFFFPIIRFHSRWNKLELFDVKKSLKKEYEEISNLGMGVGVHVMPYKNGLDYMKDRGEKIEIPEKNLLYIDKFMKKCNENNIKVLWTEIPTATSWSLAKNEKTQELANSYGVKFIDYNLENMINEIEFDFTKDTSDQGAHLNVYGAEKVSMHIGKVLAEEYNCQNHKDDARISKKFEELSQRYKKNKKRLIKEDKEKTR